MKRNLNIISQLKLPGLMLALLVLAQPVLAEVSTRLSRSTTSLDEPVSLRLEIKGDNNASPDLSVLHQDFEILGRSQQQNVSIINGKMTKSHGLSLTLLPKNLGKFTIPPIRVGNEQSEPLSLEVVESITNGDEDAVHSDSFIQLELNKKEAYLQEEVILSVKLYQAEGVRGESLTEPVPSQQDTVIRLLNEDRYQAEHEGQNYRVLERRYAVFAYQTGPLTLGDIRFRGRSGDPSQSIFRLLQDPFNIPNMPGRESRIVRIQSEQVELNILPVPAGFAGKRWLPARNLQIVESGLHNGATVAAGNPAQRRVMLFADGLTAAQLPPIEFELPNGIKQYPERPQVKDNLSRDGISGSRQSSITLVATNPGSYQLPAIEIPWWNTETGQQEIAHLPARTIEVIPNLSASTPAAKSQTAMIPEEANPAPTQVIQNVDSGSMLPGWLVWLLGLGWLATLVGWWLSHRKKPTTTAKAPVEANAEKPLKDKLPEIKQTLRLAYEEKDREAARKAWLDWGVYRWPGHPPSNLNRLAERCSRKVALAVTTLDKAFYNPADPDDWTRFNPQELLSQHRPVQTQPLRKGKLIPLNP